MSISQYTVIEIKVRALWYGVTPCFNICRYQYQGASVISDSTLLADMTSWASTWMGQYDDVQVSAMTYQTWVVNEVYPNARFIGNVSHGKANGVQNTDPLPLGACWRILKYSANPRVRGSSWIAGGAKTWAENGALTSTAITELSQLAPYMVIGATLSGRTYLGCSINKDTHNVSLWNAWKIDPYVSYLTRRIPRY
jgi:hypothetical protein